jgi:hypothetical protein
MSKFLLNLLVQISKALEYSKIQFLFEKEFSSDFGPSGPPPLTLAHYAPQAAGSPLGPHDPSRVGVFTEMRIPFDFAHSSRDAFFLTCHYHVGARLSAPSPSPRRSTIAASPRLLRPCRAARPPTSGCQARSSLPALIPPLNFPP